MAPIITHLHVTEGAPAEYLLLTHYSLVELNAAVTAYLINGQGWHCQGGGSVSMLIDPVTEEFAYHYGQALIRYAPQQGGEGNA